MRTRHLLLAAVLLASGCGGDDDSQGASGDDTTSTTADGAGDGSTTTGAEPGDEGAGDDVEAYESELYGGTENWLCHPDLDEAADACRRGLDTTVVTAEGDASVEVHEAATDPAIDCFYVYPTISTDPEGNSDLEPSESSEIMVVQSQFARLSSQCRLFAPVYRQRTLTALTGGGAADEEAVRAMAYGDVLDAWKEYLANHSEGRGFVLVGHSQGAGILGALIAEQIDGDEDVRARLVAAYLLGASVTVPEGADVGGDFQHVPLCRETTQVGCVVSYATFRSTSPPPATSFFGRPRGDEGGVAACTNPAALGGGSAELHPYFPADRGSPWADPAAHDPVETPWFSLPGLLTAECVERDGFSYLELTVHGEPADDRVDDIGGDLTPEWGLHLVDVNIAMGDIEALVGQQAAAYAG
jgi:hypothetical protein